MSAVCGPRHDATSGSCACGMVSRHPVAVPVREVPVCERHAQDRLSVARAAALTATPEHGRNATT